MAKVIMLTRGFQTVVDDEDFEWLNSFRWHVYPCAGLFYATRSVQSDGKRSMIRMHRLIIGAEPGQVVDHANRNGLDNQRSNLRLCSATENNRNRASIRQRAGELKGVSWRPRGRKWEARIRIGAPGEDGKRALVRLGRFTDRIEAAKAYDAAARKHFGEFASVNFPLETERARLSAAVEPKETP